MSWIVSNGADRYCRWGKSGPIWAKDQTQATHFARRADAEGMVAGLEVTSGAIVVLADPMSRASHAERQFLLLAEMNETIVTFEYLRRSSSFPVVFLAKMQHEVGRLFGVFGRRVQHGKRGSYYDVLGEAEAQVSTGADGKPIGLGLVRQRSLVEGAKLTVYRDPTDGQLFVRFPDEFGDGRFVELSDG